MKLLRYGERGHEKPGLLDASGCIRDLSKYLIDFDPKHLANQAILTRLQDLDIESLPVIEPSVRLGACVGSPGKIIFVGLNSARHTKELGLSLMPEDEMLVFMKPTSAACGPHDPILYTRLTQKLDWEAELGMVIGKQGKYIDVEKAHDYIVGYTCVNDLSERFLQLECGDSQFTKGKCFDNAAPLGPYLVTKDEVEDPNQLEVNLWVNKKLRQAFNTRDYIHDDRAVVSYVSQYFTLYPGDIISMGSAPGNAKYWGEDQYLKPDDEVVLSIEGLGTQRQIVIHET
jgi:2-keto-4-pentenoate hydratase/2-oxohepta-3-ene-1,7-dioic acid hydratase in catechol pathway